MPVIVGVPHSQRAGNRTDYNFDGVISNNWSQYNRSFSPNAGNKSNWEYTKPDGKNDGTWVKNGYNPTGGTETVITADGAGGGNSRCVNGRYIRTVRVGGGSQRWLSSQITGFAIDWKYTRDGNNSVAPLKFGAWFENYSSSVWVWSGELVSLGSKNTQYRYSGNFDSATLNKLNDSDWRYRYHLKYIMVSVSSARNGTGGACRESEVLLKNLRMKWKTQDGKKLLLPKVATGIITPRDLY